jgi:hypothetical protein
MEFGSGLGSMAPPLFFTAFILKTLTMSRPKIPLRGPEILGGTPRAECDDLTGRERALGVVKEANTSAMNGE